MTFEEVYETLPANGWLTKPEAKLLWTRANKTTGPILEVGCYFGRSTVLLAALGRAMYCVDPFDGFDSDLPGHQVSQRCKSNLEERGITNVMLYQQRIETLRSLASVEFAYLDGDHTYEGTTSQIRAAINWQACEMCIHDYSDTGDGAQIKRAIQDSSLVIVEIVEEMAFCRTVKNNALPT